MLKVNQTFELLLQYISITMLKILLVEDNKTISNNIKKFLELDWHSVMVAENGLYAMEVIKNNIYDIVLLDLMLPWMDGIAICKNLKSLQPWTPVIMTTAKWQLDDKLEWFDSGADDYLVKPFDIQELVARIWAVLKRTPKREILEIWEIILDREQKKVTKSWEELKFTLKEFLILEMLLLNIGLSISRTDIIENIWWWENIFEEDSKLDVYISNLRKKLGKDLIETVKWYGYRIG